MAISDILEESQLLRFGRWFSELRGDLTGGLTAAVVALPLALVLAVEVGLIAAGVLFIKWMSDLDLVKIPETEVFPADTPLELGKEIAVYRVDGSVFFGAAERFVTFLRDKPEVKYLILRMRFVPNIDTTGLVALEDIYYDLERHNCRLILTGLQPQVKELLKRSGLLKIIGLSNCFETTTDAMRSLTRKIEGCSGAIVTNFQAKELMELND